MGENTEVTGQDPLDRIHRDIRHTEADISKTVHSIEQKLSPANLKRQAVRKAQNYVWKSVASVLDLVQRRPLQAALVGTGALFMMLRRKRPRSRAKTAAGMELAGTAAKAFVSGVVGKASKEASHSGKSVIWKGLATALGAAAGTIWYRRKSPQSLKMAGQGTEQPRAGAYPGLSTPHIEPIRQ